MEPASQTLLRLELETHAYHRDADHAWLELMTPFLTRATYAERLARAYQVEAPLEAALAHTPHVTSFFGTRTRSSLLRRDLFELDYPLRRHAPLLIEPFPSVCEALGWLYVIERSPRLFEIVRRNVVARIPDAPTEYLTDHQAQARWNELTKVLDRVASTPEILAQIVHAAHDAFRCALDWGQKPSETRTNAAAP
jgi:heme oxygenase